MRGDRSSSESSRGAAARRLGALLAPIALLLTAPLCGPPPAPPAPDQVRTIEDFIACVNGRLAGNPDVTAADTVQCLPKGCSVTLTMSNQSAQAGCFAEGGGRRCQLPRVILECPGPPKLMPSYLLCPEDSVSEGVAGRDRVEIGQSIDTDGNLRMADVPVPPGAFSNIDASGAISKVTGSDDKGTKGCNDGGCHDAQAPTAGAPTEQPSQPLDPFTSSRGNPDCIISTDRCDQNAITEPKQCFPATDDPRDVVPQSLAEVCDCIEQARQDDANPLSGEQVANLICDALRDYQENRGVCSSPSCPPATGPECLQLGDPCDPANGNLVQTTSGSHCLDVGLDHLECVSDCPCRSYTLDGGGKFLVGSSVSMVRVTVSGAAGAAGSSAVHDSVSISGDLSGFEYEDRTLVGPMSFESFDVTRSGADFTAKATGTADVNGAPTGVEFTATQSGATTTFEVRDADTSAVLLGGTGEAGRAGFSLSVSPP